MRYALLIILLSIHSLAQAQVFSRALRYTTSQGLSHSFSTSVAEDGLGFIWIGTHEGLNRYDGTRFTTFLSRKEFALPSNYITKLRRIDQRLLFIGTTEGAAILDVKTLALTVLETPAKEGKKIPSDVQDIQIDAAGNLVVGTDGYVAIYDKDYRLRKFFSANPGQPHRGRFCMALFKLKNGITLMQQNAKSDKLDFLLFDNAYNGYKSDTIPFAAFYQQFYTNATKPSLLTSWLQEGNKIYFCYLRDGQSYMSELELQHYAFTQRQVNPPASEKRIYRTIPVNDSLDIITSYYGNPFFSNKKTQQCFPVYENDPLWFSSWPDGLFNSFIKTATGIWVTTSKELYYLPYYSRGVQRVPGLHELAKTFVTNGMFSSIEKSGSSFIVNALAEGFFIIDATASSIKYTNTVGKFKSFSVCQSVGQLNGDTVLLNSGYGLCWLNTKNFKTGWLNWIGVPSWMKQETGRGSHYKDRRGHIWLFYSQGLVELDAVNHTCIVRKGQVPGSSVVYENITTATENSSGLIFFAGSAIGLIQYDPQRNSFQQVTKYLNKTDTTIKSAREILFDGNNGLYMVNRRGLLHYDIASKSSVIYNKASGLSTIDINSFALDADKQLWIATSNGLSRFDPISKQFVTYYTQNGLPDNTVHTVVRWNAEGTELAVGFDKDISIIRPKELANNAEVPKTRIITLLINNRPMTLPANDELQLVYTQDNITIGYTGINFNQGQLNGYAYQLEGYDTAWNYVRDQTTAAFINLSPGTYHFRVKSANSQGIWSDEVAVLTIHIAPPFWQCWWFIALVIVVVLGGIILAFRLQATRLRKKESEKLKINTQINELKMTALRSQLNPHFIFNALNSIQFFVLDNKPEEASRYLSRFAKLFRLVLDNANNNFISLKKETDWLIFYAEIEAVRFNNHFHFTLEVEEGIDAEQTLIPSMLIQPHIENAILHGLARKGAGGILKVEFIKEGESYICCTITDNGVGREMAAAAKSSQSIQRESKGTAIIHERIELLKVQYGLQASYDTEDLYDENGQAAGTRVTLKLPVQLN